MLTSTPRLIDATATREHLALLTARGVRPAQAAASAGVSEDTVHSLARNQQMVRPSTAEKILKVPVPADLVDATGAVRMLQSLIAAGFPARALAGRLGVVRDSELRRLLSSAQVPAALDAAARALFEELRGESPLDHGATRRTVHAARYRARQHDWAPPEAWVEVDIDDPAAVPVVVPRVCRPLVVAADYAAEKDMFGGSDRDIAAKLGMSLPTMQRNLLRARDLATAGGGVDD